MCRARGLDAEAAFDHKGTGLSTVLDKVLVYSAAVHVLG
jgi:hypothetical protein